MKSLSREERIAQLLARAQAERVAAEFAIYEVREQFAPLRSAAGVLGAAARVLSPGGAAGDVIGTTARLAVRNPWLTSVVVAGAARLLRRRPIALLLPAAAAAAAWWLLRPAPRPANGPEGPG